MKKPQRIIVALVAALGSHFTLLAQTNSVVVEAESGTSTNPPTPVAGSTTGDWAVRTVAAAGTTPAINYITTLTNVADYTAPTSPGGGVGGSAPATAARVLSYTVTFPAAGTYDLYARVRVGPNGADDDSFFYGSTFGAKSPVTAADWVNCNNIFNVGYTTAATMVDGAGTATTQVWKWINLSQYSTFGSTPLVSYTVPAGALTQTFQIGAREDGLDFDKFVFGQKGLSYTVANLDAGAPGAVPTPTTVFIPTGQPLATGKSKYLGCAYSDAQAPYFGVYWNAVTPENGGKWGSVESTRGTYNWADLDKAYAQAKPATGTQSIFRMHTLIWGSQQPAWLKGLSDADQLAAINAWMAAVAARYPKIDFIDVVNEPINTPPTGLYTIGSTTNPAGSPDPSGGAYINALGGAANNAWIVKSFQLARQYFPTAKLMINEYSVENSTTRATAYAAIINQLKALNLIDGVGMQGHAFSTAGQTAATINANVALLAATGLPLYVTELDIDGLNDATQLAEYQRVFPLFWENNSVKGVSLWGYRPGHWRTAQGAPLVDANNNERPSLVWLRSYIQNTALGAKAASAATAGVFLYPNPAQGGSVSLSLPATFGQQAIDVLLLNSLGQTVVHQALPASAGTVRTLPLPGVAKGLYTVRLTTAAGAFSQRLTVE